MAVDIVAEWLRTGRFPQRLVGARAAGEGMVLELVQGTVRWYRTLDIARGWMVPRKPPPKVEAALLVGLYQVIHQRGAPPHAVVNETVGAARAVGGGGAVPLVNAVLRRAIREREKLEARIAALPLAARASHPDRLVERWRKRWEEGEVAALCAWDNVPAEVTVRVTARGGGLAAFRARLAAQGIETTPHPAAPGAWLTLPRGVAVPALGGYREGHFAVQDPSTRHAVALLDPQPGERILDLCAAPGGKTAMIEERMKGQGTRVAVDRHADRIALLRDTLRRMTCGGVEVREADATDAATVAQEGEAMFDRVLLDAPCTNTGVLRRRPDARWRFSARRLDRLCETQRRLLNSAARLVRPGGILVYSTCSLEREENEGQIAGWLKNNTGFCRDTETFIFPPAAETDGAYAVRLRRKSGNNAG